MNLKDKIVVITGATKGLGRTLAEAAAREGAKVVLLARDKTELEEVSKQTGGTWFVADVRDEAQLKSAAGFAVQKFGRIDAWINNAGIWIPWMPAEEMPMDRARDMVEVNLFGTMYGSRQAAAQMKKQASGAIVNIISTTALRGRAGSSGYAASKSGVIGFTKSLRMELDPLGIRVIAVYPGGMKTDIFGGHKLPGYENFLEPSLVAQAIVRNFKKENPEEELVLEYPADLERVECTEVIG